MKNFFYKVNDKEYEVIVTHKRIKNIHYRFKDDKFYISCHPFVGRHTLINGLNQFGEGLIKRSSKEKPIGDNYIYLFGEKYIINTSGKLSLSSYKEINYKNHDDLLKKLKPIFKDIITQRVRYYEGLMNVPSYTINVRNMTSRYGSNSKYSKNINFAFTLIHYSFAIIDSVVVHELAHILVFNHSKKFYDVVYKYYPNYDSCHTKLRKGVFK